MEKRTVFDPQTIPAQKASRWFVCQGLNIDNAFMDRGFLRKELASEWIETFHYEWRSAYRFKLYNDNTIYRIISRRGNEAT